MAWKQTIAKVVAWVAAPGEPPYVDNSLPGSQPYPDNSLPGSQPYPDNSLPGSQPYPDNSLPGQPPGIWGGANQPFPTPPIYIPGFPPIPVPPNPPGSSKPRGFPVLPDNPLYKPPVGGPGFPGAWVTVSSHGQSPAYGWLQAENGLPKIGTEPISNGHWVPVDTGTPKIGDKDYPPAWVWVPHIGADYGKSASEAQPKGR